MNSKFNNRNNQNQQQNQNQDQQQNQQQNQKQNKKNNNFNNQKKQPKQFLRKKYGIAENLQCRVFLFLFFQSSKTGGFKISVNKTV